MAPFIFTATPSTPKHILVEHFPLRLFLPNYIFLVAWQTQRVLIKDRLAAMMGNQGAYEERQSIYEGLACE